MCLHCSIGESVSVKSNVHCQFSRIRLDESARFDFPKTAEKREKVKVERVEIGTVVFGKIGLSINDQG